MTTDPEAAKGADEKNGPRRAGGIILGPADAVTHYEIRGHATPVIFFGSSERPGAAPMFVHDLLRHLEQPYHVVEPASGWRTLESFTDAEKTLLRPIAETLAMLDGNAFFGAEITDGREWYEQYLPEAAALYNGAPPKGRTSSR